MHDLVQVIMDAGKRGELQNVAVQVRASDRYDCRLGLRWHVVLRCSDARATRIAYAVSSLEPGSLFVTGPGTSPFSSCGDWVSWRRIQLDEIAYGVPFLEPP